MKNDFGWMTIDENGDIIAKTDVNYQSITGNDYGIGFATISSGSTIVDKYFHELIKFEDKEIVCLFVKHHDYAVMFSRNNHKAGLIDRNGKEILKCNYDEVILKKEDICL